MDNLNEIVINVLPIEPIENDDISLQQQCNVSQLFNTEILDEENILQQNEPAHSIEIDDTMDVNELALADANDAHNSSYRILEQENIVDEHHHNDLSVEDEDPILELGRGEEDNIQIDSNSKLNTEQDPNHILADDISFDNDYHGENKDIGFGQSEFQGENSENVDDKYKDVQEEYTTEIPLSHQHENNAHESSILDIAEKSISSSYNYSSEQDEVNDVVDFEHNAMESVKESTTCFETVVENLDDFKIAEMSSENMPVSDTISKIDLQNEYEIAVCSFSNKHDDMNTENNKVSTEESDKYEENIYSHNIKSPEEYKCPEDNIDNMKVYEYPSQGTQYKDSDSEDENNFSNKNVIELENSSSTNYEKITENDSYSIDMQDYSTKDGNSIKSSLHHDLDSENNTEECFEVSTIDNSRNFKEYEDNLEGVSINMNEINADNTENVNETEIPTQTIEYVGSAMEIENEVINENTDNYEENLDDCLKSAESCCIANKESISLDDNDTLCIESTSSILKSNDEILNKDYDIGELHEEFSEGKVESTECESNSKIIADHLHYNICEDSSLKQEDELDNESKILYAEHLEEISEKNNECSSDSDNVQHISNMNENSSENNEHLESVMDHSCENYEEIILRNVKSLRYSLEKKSEECDKKSAEKLSEPILAEENIEKKEENVASSAEIDDSVENEDDFNMDNFVIVENLSEPILAEENIENKVENVAEIDDSVENDDDSNMDNFLIVDSIDTGTYLELTSESAASPVTKEKSDPLTFDEKQSTKKLDHKSRKNKNGGKDRSSSDQKVERVLDALNKKIKQSKTLVQSLAKVEVPKSTSFRKFENKLIEIPGEEVEGGAFTRVVIMGNSSVTSLSKTWPSTSKIKPFFLSHKILRSREFKAVIEHLYLKDSEKILLLIILCPQELFNFKRFKSQRCQSDHSEVIYPRCVNQRSNNYLIASWKKKLSLKKELEKSGLVSVVFSYLPEINVLQNIKNIFKSTCRNDKNCCCELLLNEMDYKNENMLYDQFRTSFNQAIFSQKLNVVNTNKYFEYIPLSVAFQDSEWVFDTQGGKMNSTNGSVALDANLNSHVFDLNMNDKINSSFSQILNNYYEGFNKRSLGNYIKFRVIIIGDSWLWDVLELWPMDFTIKPLFYFKDDMTLEDINDFILNNVKNDERTFLMIGLPSMEFMEYREHPICFEHDSLRYLIPKEECTGQPVNFIKLLRNKIDEFRANISCSKPKCMLAFMSSYPVSFGNYYKYMTITHQNNTGHKIVGQLENVVDYNRFKNSLKNHLIIVDEYITEANKEAGLHNCEVGQLVQKMRTAKFFPRHCSDDYVFTDELLLSKMVSLFTEYIESVNGLYKKHKISFVSTESLNTYETILSDEDTFDNLENNKKSQNIPKSDAVDESTKKFEQATGTHMSASEYIPCQNTKNPENFQYGRTRHSSAEYGHSHSGVKHQVDYRSTKEHWPRESRYPKDFNTTSSEFGYNYQYSGYGNQRSQETRAYPETYHSSYTSYQKDYSRSPTSSSRRRYRRSMTRSRSRSMGSRDRYRSRNRSRDRKSRSRRTYSRERKRHGSRRKSDDSVSRTDSTKESEALANLWEIHNRECELYRRNPMVHPNYDRVLKMWYDVMQSQGYNIYDNTIQNKWYDYWRTKIENIFKDNWEEKKRQCLSLLNSKSRRSRSSSESYSSSSSSDSSDDSRRRKKKHKKKSKRSRRDSYSKKRSRDKSHNRDSTKKSASSAGSFDPNLLSIEELESRLQAYMKEKGTPSTLATSNTMDTPVSQKASVGSVSPNKLKDQLFDATSVLSQMAEKLGTLSVSVKHLHHKVSEAVNTGQNPLQHIDEDAKMLLDLVGDKIRKILADSNLTLVQRAIIQEASNRMTPLLQSLENYKSGDSNYGLDIGIIAKATHGKAAPDIINFIKNTLTYKGVENLSSDNLMKIYLEVKSVQMKFVSKNLPSVSNSLQTNSSDASRPQAPSFSNFPQSSGSYNSVTIGNLSKNFASSSSSIYGAGTSSSVNYSVPYYSSSTASAYSKTEQLRVKFMSLTMPRKINKYMNFHRLSFEEKNIMLTYLDELEKTDLQLARSIRSMMAKQK